MECNEDGRKCKISTSNRRGVKRKRQGGGGGGVQLVFTSTVPKAARPLPMRINLVPHYPPEFANDTPFMNNMDEISYWVYTKRAPCLLNYDNVLKRQAEQAHCSKTKPSSVQSPCEKTPTPKKKKRKLKLLDDASVSTEKQQNIYFNTTQNQKPVVSTCKSDLGSNVEFNIKSSPQNTSKRMKLQKNCQSRKKKETSKPVTSTPNVTVLRRSLRKAQKNNNNSQLDDSFQIFDTSLINGKEEDGHHTDECKEELVASGEQAGSKIPEKDKNVLNGQFEDLSDVSGFTANYIRSTKIQSTKTPRKLRNRNSRNLIKDNKNVSQEDKMVVCVNKSINPMPEAVLNSSTDSSQNVINLVTLKSNDRSNKVNKSTSMLKFMDSKLDKSQKNNKTKKANLNVSFQTKSSGSRYPKRHKNNGIEQKCSGTASATPQHTTRISKLNDSDKKENSEERITSRTRSGRRIGIKLDFTETGCSVINNSSEQMSSSALNVANPKKRGRNTNNTSTRCLRSRQNKRGLLSKDSNSESDKKIHPQSQVKKSLEKTLKTDSARNKSGFAACFSESDSESEPLKQKKFFC